MEVGRGREEQLASSQLLGHPLSSLRRLPPASQLALTPPRVKLPGGLRRRRSSEAGPPRNPTTSAPLLPPSRGNPAAGVLALTHRLALPCSSGSRRGERGPGDGESPAGGEGRGPRQAGQGIADRTDGRGCRLALSGGWRRARASLCGVRRGRSRASAARSPRLASPCSGAGYPCPREGCPAEAEGSRADPGKVGRGEPASC